MYEYMHRQKCPNWYLRIRIHFDKTHTLNIQSCDVSKQKIEKLLSKQSKHSCNGYSMQRPPLTYQHTHTHIYTQESGIDFSFRKAALIRNLTVYVSKPCVLDQGVFYLHYFSIFFFTFLHSNQRTFILSVALWLVNETIYSR